MQDKNFLDWLVDDIKTSGVVDEYVVISNHKFAGHFTEWADGRPDDRITVVDDGTSTNDTRLGAVRDIQFAIDSLGLDNDMLVIAGDNVLDFSLVRFIEYASAKGTSCIMRFFEPSEQRLRKCGVVEVDDQDLILGMEEKPSVPRSHWCCPPFYYYTRKDAARIPEGIAAGCGTDAPGSYIAWLAAQVPVHAMEMPGRRYDIGNLESYHHVCEQYNGLSIQ